MVIKNARIITPEKILDGYDVLFEEGVIKKIEKNLHAPDSIDAAGMYLSPGFVDIHTHGGYEADFMDSSDNAFAQAIKFHLDNGTTSVVATSCTASKESIISFIGFTRDYIRSGAPYGNVIVGVHLEGPYLSVRNRGAQKLEELAVPDSDDYSYIIENADVIKTVTISPELPGAREMSSNRTMIRWGGMLK